LILSEAEFVLDVALRCRDILVARGASVVLTRETADTFTAPWPVDANGDGIVGAPGDDLQERVDILNNFHAEAFLSIHANAGAMDPAHPDLQAIYCGTAGCPYPAQSAYLGQLVLQQLTTRLAAVGYTPSGSLLETDLEADTSEPPQHLFVLGPVNPPRHVRATTMPGVLAETLFVSSPREAAVLNRSDVRQAIALAYADALQAFLTGNK
jgi:N-acetylmuramoyl-L-alanine amidase